MPNYVVSPGQKLIANNLAFLPGSEVPSALVTDGLLAAGVLTESEISVPKAPPAPVPISRSFSHDAYDPKDPTTAKSVPLRLLPALLATITDPQVLLEIHEADERKGGRDLIEERLGELETEK